MLNFTRSDMSHLIHHQVGNKGLGGAYMQSLSETNLQDDFTKTQLMLFLTQNFKSDVVYEFSKKDPDKVYIGSIQDYVSDFFKHPNSQTFVYLSQLISEHLYNATMHPKCPGGTMYVAYFKDVVSDGEMVDAIGIFKKENDEQFLKPEIKEGYAVIESDYGQSIDKLEKGVLILNTAANDGYKIHVFDKGKKIKDIAFYWNQDFLSIRLKDTPYYQTSHQIMQILSFCEEVLTTENNVSVMDKKMVENKTINFFTAKDKFNPDEFNKEVLLDQEELVDSYKIHKEQYQHDYQMELKDDFDISQTAVKEKSKYASTTIHLDKNFEVKIKSRYDLMDQGFDEEKGLKYIKLWYSNDEFK
jgi:hypothetical protein